MVYLHFNNKTVIPCIDLKNAYKVFMSNSRFFIRKMNENFTDAIVYVDNKKKYNWTYCKELCPEYDDLDYDYNDDDDPEPIVYIAGPYYFYSQEVKNV